MGGNPRKPGENRWTRPACALLGVAILFAGCVSEPVAPPAPPPAPAPAPLPEPPPCLRILRIEVSKSERRLSAHCEGGVVVEMTVALGRENGGPKRQEGDMRTPEGWYRVSGPARPSRFHLFLPIDYPSLDDALAAREDKRLSKAEFRRILAALAEGEAPPPNTALGGHLGFHGEGDRWRGDSDGLDWTLGCVAVSDANMEFLAAHTEVGTPVVIRP
jgi:murein L,D-transpeptidase YafK